MRCLASFLVFLSLSACGDSASEPDVESKKSRETCGDRLDGNGDGLDDYADPDCLVDEALREQLQEIVDRSRGNAVGLVLGVETTEGKVGLVTSGHVMVGGRELLATDRFPIGSMTKTFTAVVVMQLRDEGKLTLDDALEKWLPTFPNSDRITLSHLLSHTSGIFNHTDSEIILEKIYGGSIVTPAEILEVAAARPLYFEPGEGYQYSNTNYIILGLVIEALTGNTAAAEMRSRILEPLGMKDTFLSGSEEVPGGLEVHGYLVQGPLDDDYDFTHLYDGLFAFTGGALVSSAPDILRFSHGLFQGELLSADTFAEMKAGVGPQDYGYGIVDQLGWVGHNGAMPGWRSDWRRLDNGATVIAIQNRLDDGWAIHLAIDHAVDML